MALKIMLQGTSSNVGKSVLTAALCRVFRQDGLRVVPFKAQNMALNSAVTVEGGEIGRAQALQALAAGLEPSVKMNPVLLKPSGNMSSQVVVLGKPVGVKGAREYHRDMKEDLVRVIADCLDELDRGYDAIVIEGAGSPAEVNLRETDLANMRVARMAPAPVLLIADIDRGGALASVVGTLELLLPEERAMVKGIVFNKFRGDIELLRPAIEFLEEKTGLPVVGVVPYADFGLPEEDSVALERAPKGKAAALDVAVIRLPLISNFTDFDALAAEPDVSLRYVRSPGEIGRPDLLIIPGSKNTIADALYLEKSGLKRAIIALRDTFIVGICGGYQLLGKRIEDPLGVEAGVPFAEGLDLLPVTTVFSPKKRTVRAGGRVLPLVPYLAPLEGVPVEGYEIHMGQSERHGGRPFLRLEWDGDEREDGTAIEDRPVLGTYLHGLFDSDRFRRGFLDLLRKRKGLPPLGTGSPSYRDEMQRRLDRLADVARESLDLGLIYRIMEEAVR